MLGLAKDSTPGYVERFGPEASAIGPPEGHSGERLTYAQRSLTMRT